MRVSWVKNLANYPTHARSILLLVLLLATLANCIRRPRENQQSNASSPALAADDSAGNSSKQKQCPLPFDGTYVSDFAQVVKPESIDALEVKLSELKKRASIDFAVVTVKTTGEQPIFDYSLALARCWGVGEKNPDRAGLLLLLAVDDRKWHMQISRSIEKVLSNEEIQDAGSLMTPHLRNGNYSEGLHKFVDATIETLGPRRGFATNLNQ